MQPLFLLRYVDSVGSYETLGCSVGGVYEVDVVGRTAWSVDGQDGEGLLENGDRVDDGLAEEDEFAGTDLSRRVVGDSDFGAAGEDVEVFIATEVIVRGSGAVDAEDAAACGLLVGEPDVCEHGFGISGKRGG